MNKHLKYFKEDERILKVLVEGFNHTFNMTEKLSPQEILETQRNFRELSHSYGLTVDKKSPMNLLKGESPTRIIEYNTFVVLKDMIKDMSDYKALTRIFIILTYFLTLGEKKNIQGYLKSGIRRISMLFSTEGIELIVELLNARSNAKDYNTLSLPLMEHQPIVDLCKTIMKSTRSSNLHLSTNQVNTMRISLSKLAYWAGHRSTNESFFDMLRLSKEDWNNKEAGDKYSSDMCYFLLKHLSEKPKHLNIKFTLKFIRVLLDFYSLSKDEGSLYWRFTQELAEGKKLTVSEKSELYPLVQNYNSLAFEGKPYPYEK